MVRTRAGNSIKEVTEKTDGHTDKTCQQVVPGNTRPSKELTVNEHNEKSLSTQLNDIDHTRTYRDNEHDEEPERDLYDGDDGQPPSQTMGPILNITEMITSPHPRLWAQS